MGKLLNHGKGILYEAIKSDLNDVSTMENIKISQIKFCIFIGFFLLMLRLMC